MFGEDSKWRVKVWNHVLFLLLKSEGACTEFTRGVRLVMASSELCPGYE